MSNEPARDRAAELLLTPQPRKDEPPRIITCNVNAETTLQLSALPFEGASVPLHSESGSQSRFWNSDPQMMNSISSLSPIRVSPVKRDLVESVEKWLHAAEALEYESESSDGEERGNLDCATKKDDDAKLKQKREDSDSAAKSDDDNKSDQGQQENLDSASTKDVDVKFEGGNLDSATKKDDDAKLEQKKEDSDSGSKNDDDKKSEQGQQKNLDSALIKDIDVKIDQNREDAVVDSNSNGDIKPVREELEENVDSASNKDADVKLELNRENGVSDATSNTDKLDQESHSEHQDSLYDDIRHVTELLREEHAVIKELDRENRAMYRDLRDSRRHSRRLESENAILRKRLIKKNYENTELQMQLDTALAFAEEQVVKEKGSSRETPSAVPSKIFKEVTSDIPQSKQKETNSSGPSYLRGLYQRTASARSVVERARVEAVSGVSKRNLMKWVDDTLPSLDDEVSEEAKKMKELLSSSKTDLHGLDRPIRGNLRMSSMRNLLP